MINIIIEKEQHRICQGDIYKNVKFLEYIAEERGNIEISTINFPLVIVLTQDCDLERDHEYRETNKQTQDKLLISAIVVPIYNADFVFEGSHLSELGLKMQPFSKNKTPENNIKINNDPRYHYLEFPEEVNIQPSIIDFKHYFSINLEYLRYEKKEDYICQVSSLYREDISQRFSSFLSRIGLP